MSLYKSVVLTKTASNVLAASIHVNEVIMALFGTFCSVNIRTFRFFRPNRWTIRIQDCGRGGTPELLI
jgi:hypothetical protein